MSEGTFFRRLHGSAIRVQVPLVLAAVPVAASLYGFAVAPVVVDALVVDAGAEARAAARTATLVVVALLLAAVATATTGAALLLRGSVRSVVERMRAATAAIAGGDFSHRIDSSRTDEFGALAGSIDTMAERLQRLEEARRRVLACVSHELRTPLTIIRGHAFTLARHEHDASRRERLEMMQHEATRLGELIEDLVDASTLHAGSIRLRVQRCDLGDLVDWTVARFRQEASQRDVRIERRGSSRSLPVDADPARIEQLLGNLVGNAIRHATPGTAIVLGVEASRGSGPRFVTVANQGTGIPSSVADTIFEPFVQGEGDAGRVGLGLAIAHGLAAAHGGTLTLESRGMLSGRVEFRLMLPPAQRVGDSFVTGPRRRRHAADVRLRMVQS